MSDAQKFWTFGEMLDKVQDDTDISSDDPDEQFIKFSEFIGYFNEGIEEARNEICALDEDYFLSKDSLIMIEGESDYPMPENIYADKIRGVVFDDGSERYMVKRLRRKDLFMNIHRSSDSDNADGAYQHYIRNDTPGERKFVLLPAAREESTPDTADLSATPPEVQAPFVLPITRYYIRNANRIPSLGEYVKNEILYPTAFNVAAGTLTVDPTFPYTTGDKIQFKLASSAFLLPSGLEEETTYYVVRVSATRIKLAASLAAARLAASGLLTGDRIQETPSGSVTGTTGLDGNAVFTLSHTPYSTGEVQVYVNGVYMRQGTHYNIAASTITFVSGFIPQVGQEIDVIYYPVSEDLTTRPTEAQVVPAGTIDGANTTFTLPSTPANAASVKLYLDGVLLEQDDDYTISGRTLELAVAPAVGQLLDAVYDTAVIFFYDQGKGYFTLKVAATRAIIEATVIDIPEFSTFIMEWVKANCLFKEGDPRLQGCIAKLEQQRKQMNDSLSNREPDDENTMELDLSFYEDMN